MALEGLSRLEVVSIAWDPHPREPVERVLWAMSVPKLEVDLADSGAEGKTRFGQRHRVVSCLGRDIEVVEVFSSRTVPDSPLSHCLSLCWFQSHVVVLGVGPQLGQAAWLGCCCCDDVSSRRFQVRLVARACTAVIAWLCLVSVGIVGLALCGPVLLVVSASVSFWFHSPVLGCQSMVALACVASQPRGVSGVRGGSTCGPSTLWSPILGCQSVVAPACVASRPRGVSGVRGGYACGTSTLWRSEVAMLAVRRRSHLVVAWSQWVFQGLLPLCARLHWSLRESCVCHDLGWWSWHCIVLFCCLVVPCCRCS
ncbi:hypothetical protein Taro_042914 [Colocasia esculenta]|uniref:Uncharacterized protein n=1 Tax=Colocasia esculenta TaxID=4460 RepID=A0A843WQ23_COLES|nr:hypothetical protein [Colocasia esculenta]